MHAIVQRFSLWSQVFSPRSKKKISNSLATQLNSNPRKLPSEQIITPYAKTEKNKKQKQLGLKVGCFDLLLFPFSDLNEVIQHTVASYYAMWWSLRSSIR